MKVDTDLPRAVAELEHVEIPMPDGTRLAARIWMPEGAETAPVPAILEYIPYRKNDKTLERDAARAPGSPRATMPTSASTCAAPANPKG